MSKLMLKGKRLLTATLYCYVEPHLAIHAKRVGVTKFGSFSSYVNYLIAKDAGDKKSVENMMKLAKQYYEPNLVGARERRAKYRKKSAAKATTKKKVARKKLAKKAAKKKASKPKAVKVAAVKTESASNSETQQAA